MAPEALIVGAGPSGLVAALTLAKNGISVRIIEKSLQQRIGQRGAGIMPRSMELFELLGIAKPILSVAFATPRVKTYELERGFHCTGTFEMAPYTEPTSAFPYMNILCLGQDKLEAIMRNELEKTYHIPVEHGVELLSFNQDDEGVDVKLRSADRRWSRLPMPQEQCETEEVTEWVDATERYRWVLGTDGARGVVRKQLDVTFLGETNNATKIVVGDIKVHGLDHHFWHMWGDAKTTLISLRPTEVPSLFNFILAGPNIDNASMASDTDALRRAFENGTGLGTQVKFGEFVWLSIHRPNIRMVDSFGHGRVYLAGDSAHVHSFTGGQGMNTGIQDSFNIGWKIAHIQRGFSPHTLLKSYSEERLPVVADMLSETTALLKQTFVANNVRPVMMGSGRNGSLLQLGVNYRWSSIVLDEQASADDDDEELAAEADDFDDFANERYTAERLHAGDRAPDARALLNLKDGADHKMCRLFDVFSCTQHTVLVFTEDAHRCSAIVKEVAAWAPGALRTVQVVPTRARKNCGPLHTDFAVEDTVGTAYDAYPLTDGCFTVVVRPDGMVGAIVQDSMGLRDYFRGVFYES